MRARLVFASIAAVLVIGLVGWGFAPHGAKRPTAASHPQPSQSAVSLSPSRNGNSSGLPAQARNWRLRLDASFSGSKLNSRLWDTCYPWIPSSAVKAGCTNFPASDPTREHEWYLPSQVRVRHGSLDLVAQRISTSGKDIQGKPMVYSCRSGMVTTYPGFHFTYGYVRIVAHIPSGAGLWPALWLAATNFRWPPEIDILEHWGRMKNPTGVFMHPLGMHQFGRPVNMPKIAKGWHNFGLMWTPAAVTWYIDGLPVVTDRQGSPHQSMYFIANVAESAPTRPGFGCQGTLKISSVEIWQAPSWQWGK